MEDEDEVVLFEPAFDIYSAQVQMAGGICRLDDEMVVMMMRWW